MRDPPPKVRYRLAVFDFDGTLVDTSLPIVLALRDALGTEGFVAPDDRAMLSLVGLPLEEILERLTDGRATAEQVARMAAQYRVRFGEEVAGRTRLFEGVPGMLARLRESGLDLAIATSRGKASLESILRIHSIFHLFTHLVSGSCVERGKPHPEMLHRILGHYGVQPHEALMVGDTTFDLQMGRAAGMDTCAVTYGAHTREALRREGPTYLVDDPGDLPAAVLA